MSQSEIDQYWDEKMKEQAFQHRDKIFHTKCKQSELIITAHLYGLLCMGVHSNHHFSYDGYNIPLSTASSKPN